MAGTDHIDCSKGPDIEKVKKIQAEQGVTLAQQSVKLDRLLDSHDALSVDLKAAIDRLTAIIEADIGTRKDVEQLKKDREVLYQKTHKVEGRVSSIEVRNAKCDGAGIFEKFPKVWDWFQAELGWRRFLPSVMAFLSALFAIITFMSAHVDAEKTSHIHTPDPRGGVTTDYGVPK